VLMTRWGHGIGVALAALLLAGCAASVELSATAPSATGQLLVFRALERAAAGLDLTRLRGRRVALEVISQLDDRKSAQKFAAEYLETWMRARGVAVGADHPELRVQAYLLTLGSDLGRTFLGIPAFQVPVVSIPIPEIAIFKWQRSHGVARPGQFDIWQPPQAGASLYWSSVEAGKHQALKKNRPIQV